MSFDSVRSLRSLRYLRGRGPPRQPVAQLVPGNAGMPWHPASEHPASSCADVLHLIVQLPPQGPVDRAVRASQHVAPRKASGHIPAVEDQQKILPVLQISQSRAEPVDGSAQLPHVVGGLPERNAPALGEHAVHGHHVSAAGEPVAEGAAVSE